MKLVKLALVRGFFGFDFQNKEALMSEPLNHKGLFMPKVSRIYGGRKTQQNFLVDKNDLNSIAVSIIYSDVIVSGVITEISQHCKYFDANGDLYCEKIEINNVRNEDKLKRSRYDAAYSHLKDTAKGTAIENHVNSILNHYSREVNIWLLGNPQAFIDAINAEPQTIKNVSNQDVPNPIYIYLNIVVGIGGKRVQDSILEQLTGFKFITA